MLCVTSMSGKKVPDVPFPCDLLLDSPLSSMSGSWVPVAGKRLALCCRNDALDGKYHVFWQMLRGILRKIFQCRPHAVLIGFRDGDHVALGERNCTHFFGRRWCLRFFPKGRCTLMLEKFQVGASGSPIACDEDFRAVIKMTGRTQRNKKKRFMCRMHAFIVTRACIEPSHIQQEMHWNLSRL